MVNKNWTLEEALAANEAALLKDPERSDSDPTLPFFQWAALRKLDDYEKNFVADGYWLMTAIRTCANHDLPLPEWAAKAYIKAYDTVNNARAKSWDAVFGNPFPKGRHLNADRKRRMLTFAVWNEVTKMLSMKPNTALDEGLFETVGKKFAIGKTLASEYYYTAKNLLQT
ncbi:MAG TPA: hypothetical protein VFK88_02525 [Gallionella sp.]|nr:hypothetical protein [Gallionella sp.]